MGGEYVYVPCLQMERRQAGRQAAASEINQGGLLKPACWGTPPPSRIGGGSMCAQLSLVSHLGQFICHPWFLNGRGTMGLGAKPSAPPFLPDRRAPAIPHTIPPHSRTDPVWPALNVRDNQTVWMILLRRVYPLNKYIKGNGWMESNPFCIILCHSNNLRISTRNLHSLFFLGKLISLFSLVATFGSQFPCC